MAIGELLHSVTALVSSCSKHVSHAVRKLRSHSNLSKLAATSRVRKSLPLLARGASFVPFLHSRKRAEDDGKSRGSDEDTDFEEEEEEEDGVWRKAILMGEKCQPLDFSGVIYYDSNGKQLSEIPAPRTPLRSPLPSFAYQSVIVEGDKLKEGLVD